MAERFRSLGQFTGTMVQKKAAILLAPLVPFCGQLWFGSVQHDEVLLLDPPSIPEENPELDLWQRVAPHGFGADRGWGRTACPQTN